MAKKKSSKGKKSKSSMEAKSKRKEAEGSANQIHEAMGNMIGDFSKQTLTSESERLLAKLQPGCRLPPADARAVVTELARLAGTDTARNDTDPQGNGDQSPVTAQTTVGRNGAPSRLAGAAFDAAKPYRQVLRELWSAGGTSSPTFGLAVFLRSPWGAASVTQGRWSRCSGALPLAPKRGGTCLRDGRQACALRR